MGEICLPFDPQMTNSDPSNPMNQPFEAMGAVVDFEVPLRYSDMDLFGHVVFGGGADRLVRSVHPREVGL